MKWKLTHTHGHESIENDGGKTLSYNPNLGIQIIECDGYAFKDLNNNGKLDPYEDWRLPLTMRVQDFTNRFTLWQEEDCLYYRKGKITMPKELMELMSIYHCQDDIIKTVKENELEDIAYLKENYLIGLLLLMFDDDQDTGKEDYLMQLIIQSMDLGLLENIMYSIKEALRKYLLKRQLVAKSAAVVV